MKNIKRIIAASMVLALAVCTLCTPAYAASVSKDESVYVTLNTDGTVAATTVSEWLHSDGGFNGYQDASLLKDIKNLRSDDMPAQDGTTLTWTATDTSDIYYQGTTTAQLPVTSQIIYYLDGTQISAKDAEGKSGHLKIDIALTNNMSKTAKVSGSDRTVYVPFVVAVGADLPVDGFNNVVATNGTVQTDSSNQIVAFVCMPGMKESFDGLLSGKLADIQDKFIDSVSIEADVTDLEVPSIMIAYATDASLLDKEINTANYGDAFSDIDKLTNATQQLVDGANELSTYTAQLVSGTNTISNGAGTLSGGAAQLSAGAAQLSGGLQVLSGKSSQLNDGAKQIAAAILETANTQIQAAVPGTETITLDNYATVLGNILNVTDAMRAQARATVAGLSGLPDANNADGSNNLTALIYMSSLQPLPENPTLDNYKAVVAAAGALMQEVNAATTSGGAIYNATAALTVAGNNPLAVPANMQVLTAMAMQTLGTTDPTLITPDVLAQTYASLAANLGDISDANKALIITMACTDALTGTDLTTAMGNAGALAAKAQSVQGALVASATGASDEAVKAFLTQLVIATSGTQFAEISKLLNSLQSLNTFLAGVKQYTDGVDTAYAGAKTVSAGATTVSNGAAELSQATATAADGAAQINSGAKILSNGVQQFKTDGIDKITDMANEYDIDGIVDTVNALRDAASSYRNFAGAATGTTTTTKFVMKTSVPSSADDKTAQEAEESVPTNKTTFWERIKNLFKI